MYSHVLPFQNICSLTYFQIKVRVRVDEAENIRHAFYKPRVFFGSPASVR